MEYLRCYLLVAFDRPGARRTTEKLCRTPLCTVRRSLLPAAALQVESWSSQISKRGSALHPACANCSQQRYTYRELVKHLAVLPKSSHSESLGCCQINPVCCPYILSIVSAMALREL